MNKDCSITRADALDFLHSLPEGSVDLVLTDPPYGTIVLRCSQYHSRRRIDGLYKHIRVDKQIEGLGIATEGESIMPASAHYETLNITRRKNKLGGYTYVFEAHEI